MGDEFGRRADDRNIAERVVILETQQKSMCEDIGEMKVAMRTLASKDDLISLRAYFDGRDDTLNRHLWWVIKAFIVVLGVVSLTAFGVEQIPGMFH